MPDRAKSAAEDLWNTLSKYRLRDQKSIVVCVDDAHAAFKAQELRRFSGGAEVAAKKMRTERNTDQPEQNFARAHTVSTAVNRPPIAVNHNIMEAIPVARFDADFSFAVLLSGEEQQFSQSKNAGQGASRLQHNYWPGVSIPFHKQAEEAVIVAAGQKFDLNSDSFKPEVWTYESEAMRAAMLRKAFAGEHQNA